MDIHEYGIVDTLKWYYKDGFMYKSKLMGLRNKALYVKVHDEVYNDILEKTKEIDTDNINERIYCYLNDIKNPPKCSCGNNLSFKNMSYGYFKSCSKDCSDNITKIPIVHKSDKRQVADEFVEWLNSLELNYECDKKINSRYTVNFFFPDFKIAIDYVELYGGSELFYNKKHKINKLLYLKKQGIQLVTVFENEWKEKQDIVKSIISAKVKKFKLRVYARQCDLMEISQEDYKNFVLENHVQGYVAGKIKLGLFYNGELIQICSFGKSRFKKNEVELIRSCSRKYCQVVGGFSRLINYFVKEYNIRTIVSFADLRYFDAHGYIDWEIIDVCNPNYWYWDQKHMGVESRIKYQKHKLPELLEHFDIKKTEVENMYDNGFIRIWDCGNFKLKKDF